MSDLGCEFGADKWKKPFTVSWKISGNRACHWYCGQTPVKQGSFWHLCKQHWKEVGYKMADWWDAKVVKGTNDV